MATKLIACQECKRQWDVSRYRVGQKLRCACNFVMEVPRLRSYTPEVAHCQNCGASRSANQTPCRYCGAVPTIDSAKLSLVCPLCLRRTPKKSRFCASCGKPLTPAALDVKTGKLTCPRCGKPKLVNRKVGNFTVDECPSCSGMWVEGNSFDSIVRQQAQRSKEEYRRGKGTSPILSQLDKSQTHVMYMKCPVCGTHMHRRNFMRASGVIIDECRKDGVWLDCDELGKIGDYISSGGLERSRRIVKREEEETRRIPMVPVNRAPYANVELQTTRSAGEDMLSSVLLFIDDLLD